MSNFRQYMSEKQQMVSGPTRGDQARSDLRQDRLQSEADAKIAAETARREEKDAAMRAEDRAYYEGKEAQQKADDDARYAQQTAASYESGYANQTSAAVNPQGSGTFMPNNGNGGAMPPGQSAPSALPAASNELRGRDKRAAARSEMSVGERRTAQAKSGLNMTDFKAGYQSLKNA